MYINLSKQRILLIVKCLIQVNISVLKDMYLSGLRNHNINIKQMLPFVQTERPKRFSIIFFNATFFPTTINLTVTSVPQKYNY